VGSHKRTIRRYHWRVVITVVLVVASFAAYIWADAVDLVPGPITIRSRQASDAAPILNIVEPKSILPEVEKNSPIDRAAAQKLVENLVIEPNVGDDVSVIIMNQDGTVAAERDSHTLREPASTLKTLTAAAAATTLDMSSRIHTSVYSNEISGNETSIVLKSEGDMLLGSEKNDFSHVNGRAGLATLAEQTAKKLQAHSVSSVKLGYDTSFFGSIRSPQSIGSNDPERIYFTPTSTMAIDEGRKRTNQDRLSNPDKTGVYLPRVADPERQVVQSFADSLRQYGIAVSEVSEVHQATDNTSRVIAQVESASLSEIMAYMLRTSDNTLSELFGRLTAHALGEQDSPQGAVQAVKQALEKLNIPINDIQMSDCSGLSPGSRLSVSTLVKIQQAACDGEHKKLLPLLEGLSVVGLVGTAASRGEGDEPNGLVRVKTGSLGEVTALSGNVSRRKGGVLLFAVVVNNPKDIGSAVSSINKFMSVLPQL
jgi:serine-type D-Ala-D-Ala carboxypeptidase/endopeptidase (penicillin-binding protein 4)